MAVAGKQMTEPVVFTRHALAGGFYLGQVQLNAPQSLNAISLDMIRAIEGQLREWAADPKLVVVWLDAAGEKAFCAGGDIVQLYNSMVAAEAGAATDNAYARDFFSEEYRLDYMLHTYPKPVVCWGSGIVMGGGVGLMSACSHRIVTESSRIAMPEVTIGLFPDVGGSWFLSRMPGKAGLFLGITGASLNAADALYAGYADYLMGSDSREAALNTLLNSDNWEPENASELVSSLLGGLEGEGAATQPESQVQHHQARIDQLCDAPTLGEVVQRITSLETDDKWLQRSVATLAKGCPVTVRLIDEQLKRAASMSIADVFRMEFNMAMHCARNPDFREGVRALLIDKDGAPAWSYSGVEAVPDDYINAHFEAAYTEHPLADLK